MKFERQIGSSRSSSTWRAVENGVNYYAWVEAGYCDENGGNIFVQVENNDAREEINITYSMSAEPSEAEVEFDEEGYVEKVDADRCVDIDEYSLTDDDDNEISVDKAAEILKCDKNTIEEIIKIFSDVAKEHVEQDIKEAWTKDDSVYASIRRDEYYGYDYDYSD